LETEPSTRQIVYVAENANGLYLSETALRDLGIIPQTFPECNSNTSGIQSTGNTDHLAPCGCLRRNITPSHPEKIPFPPTPSHRKDLEDWILHHFESSAFNICKHQPLQPMSGEPLGITFNEDPTVWCSRMVFAPKKDGSPRRTIDLQQVNKAALWETHHMPTPFHHANTVPAGTKKTTLDAWNGYHSLPLTQEATTFIREWGCYRYCRAPMGFHASGDAYTRRFDDFTKGIPRKTRCVDDSLLWDSDIQDAFWHTLDYIKLKLSRWYKTEYGDLIHSDRLEQDWHWLCAPSETLSMFCHR